MIKRLDFTFDIDEERIESAAPLPELFGLTEERCEFLCSVFTTMRDARIAAARARGEKAIDTNKLSSFSNFISTEVLTGNDVAFLCYCGFIVADTTGQTVLDLLRDPLALLAAMHRFK